MTNSTPDYRTASPEDAPDSGVSSRRIVVGPFNRVEGDLEVQLDVDGGRVTAAYVNASLYRGFEQLLVGRDPFDALVLVPRICGICSVSQSAAAVAALTELGGYRAPANGRLASNLILASEVVVDHLTHFYLFFMPDFARDAYAARPWHAAAVARFKALSGSAGAEFLPARAGLLRVLALLAGKWPHTLALRPGGTTRALQRGEKARLRLFLREFRQFLESVLFADRLEAVAGLESADALARWARGRPGDCAHFLALSDDLGLARVGRASDCFLSAGAYPQESANLFAAGYRDGTTHPFSPAAITEDHTSAWLEDSAAPLSPASGMTRPQADKAGAYSWCKAPRYAGRVVETGALARQLIDGQPLLNALVAQHGGSVTARIVARLVEVASLVPEMERWVDLLVEGEPFFASGELPASGSAVGLVEAARGTLGHWVSVEDGRIARYQIVAPTTWNFSPRDAAGQPGALEQALAGLDVGSASADAVVVQHVVRSFDPCMVCTVH